MLKKKLRPPIKKLMHFKDDSFGNLISATGDTIYFITITDAYRLDGSKPDYLSGDGLHPSKLEYTKWAIKLTQQIVNVLKSVGLVEKSRYLLINI